MSRTYCSIAFLIIVCIFSFEQTAAHSATWQSVAPLNTGRSQFAGGVIDGKIFVFGGNSRTEPSPLNSTEMFDASVGSWVYKADNNNTTGVEEVTGAVVNGKFYVFGDASGEDPYFDGVYDPTVDAWAPIAPMLTPRSNAPAVAYNGKIYVFAGNGAGGVHYTLVEAYDPGSDTWQTVTNIPQVVASPAVALVGDNVYVIGGGSPSEGKMVNTVYMYNFTTDTWKTSGFAPLPNPRAFECNGAAPVVDGKIYLIGGLAGTKSSLSASKKVDIYDTVSNTWQSGTPLPTPIFSQFSTILNNLIYVVGGNTSETSSGGNNNASITAAVWVYDLLAPPGQPTSVKATATGVGQVTVAFKAPTSSGSSPIAGYAVTSSPAGGVDSNAGSPSLPHIVTGLANGSSYTFTVTVTNQDGMQATSKASSKVKTWSAPGTPKITSLKAGNEEVTVTFSASKTDPGDPVSYTVTAAATGQSTQTASGSKSPLTVTNLTNNVTYTFTVTATNQVGSSVSPSKSLTLSAPTPPKSNCVQISGGNSYITVKNNSSSMIEVYFGETGQVPFGAAIGAGDCNIVGIEVPSSYTLVFTAEITQCNSPASTCYDELFGPTVTVPLTLTEGQSESITVTNSMFQ
ncbi:MAG: kelch repeat-containing protein [Syntrophobacteraceae bacterium]